MNTGIHQHTKHTPTAPPWSTSFLDQKASTVLPHSMCFVYSALGKSSPICFTSVFWLETRLTVRIHDKDKVHFKKRGLLYHCAMKSPQNPAPWEIGLKTQRDLHCHLWIFMVRIFQWSSNWVLGLFTRLSELKNSITNGPLMGNEPKTIDYADGHFSRS